MTTKVTKEEHDKWFSKVLADHDNQRLFILENNDKSPCVQDGTFLNLLTFSLYDDTTKEKPFWVIIMAKNRIFQ